MDKEWLLPDSLQAKDSAKERDNELLAAVAARQPAGAGRSVSRLSPASRAISVAIHVALRKCRRDHQRYVSGGLAKRQGFSLCIPSLHLDHRHRLPHLAKSLRSQKNHIGARSVERLSRANRGSNLSNAEVQDWLTRGLSRLPVEQRLTLELALSHGSFAGGNRGDHRLSGGHRQGAHVSCARQTAPVPAGLGGGSGIA